jgi:hypothetical protein
MGIHNETVNNCINKYESKGYILIAKNQKLPELFDYRPDAVLDGEKEIVVLEVVYSSDVVPTKIMHSFLKSVRLHKIKLEYKRAYNGPEINVSKDTAERINKRFGNLINERIMATDRTVEEMIQKATWDFKVKAILDKLDEPK